MRGRLLIVLSVVAVAIVVAIALFQVRGTSSTGTHAGGLVVDVSGLGVGHVIHVDVSLPDAKHTKARVFLVHAHGKPVMALLGVSTHLGCRLLPPSDPSTGYGLASERRDDFEDPCGGSTFALDGACIAGPCPRGLDHYPVKVVDDKAEVDLEHLVRGRARRVS